LSKCVTKKNNIDITYWKLYHGFTNNIHALEFNIPTKSTAKKKPTNFIFRTRKIFINTVRTQMKNIEYRLLLLLQFNDSRSALDQPKGQHTINDRDKHKTPN